MNVLTAFKRMRGAMAKRAIYSISREGLYAYPAVSRETTKSMFMSGTRFHDPVHTTDPLRRMRENAADTEKREEVEGEPGAAPENLHIKGNCGSEVLHRFSVQQGTAKEHQRQKERESRQKTLNPAQIAQEDAELDRLAKLRIVPVFDVRGTSSSAFLPLDGAPRHAHKPLFITHPH